MSRTLLTVLVLALAPSFAYAALDPELNTPYEFQVVLRVAKHRLLTSVFKKQVQRELHDSLQAALGEELARVKMVDFEEHELRDKIETLGLQQALEGWRSLNGIKTHFVLIDFADGQYEIQTRQYDGSTGLASPVVRREHLADPAGRPLVARTAALMIDRDFGLVGTIAEGKDREFRVFLKGGGLKTALDRWVKKDEVFAIAAIGRVGGAVGSRRVDGALLRALEDPRDGVVRCRLFFRYKDPLVSGPSVLGYRCIKLGTIEGHCRLRFVDETTRNPVGRTLPVVFSAFDFQNTSSDNPATNIDGFVQSKEKYKHVAFVRVLRSGQAAAQIPVEILDDRPVVCSIQFNEKADRQAQLDLQRRRWITQLYESCQVVNVLIKSLNELVKKGDHAKALANVKKGLEALDADIANGNQELDTLKEAGEKPDGPNLKDGVQRLEELKKDKKLLQDYVGQLEKVLDKETDPKYQELKELIAQARGLEKTADFDKAIEVYEQVLAKEPDPKEIKAHLEQLKQAWTPKSDKHKAARQFIYEVWPKKDTADQMKANMTKAKEAFEVCRAAKDYMTPVKMLNTNVAHTSKLLNEQKALQLDIADDFDTNKMIGALAGELGKLTEEITDFLKPKPAEK